MVLHNVVVMGIIKNFCYKNTIHYGFGHDSLFPAIDYMEEDWFKNALLKWLILWGLRLSMDIAIFAMFLVCSVYGTDLKWRGNMH